MTLIRLKLVENIPIRSLIVNEMNYPYSDVATMNDVAPEGSEPESNIASSDLSDASPVDPVRSAAGRLGGQRVHKLAVLGREYEKEHGLSPGRERLKYLIKLGKRYEVEHGLRVTKPRRRRKGDAWPEFLAALARVVQPAYRPAVEQLVASFRPKARSEASGEQAA